MASKRAGPADVAPIRPGEQVPANALVAYVHKHLPGLGILREILQFPHGSANLTYLLRFENRDLVLRRPPLGALAAGAHDMAREYRALRTLWQEYPKAPRAYAHCADSTVIGAEFTLLEYRTGEVIRSSLPASMTHHHDAARRIGFAVVDALAELHSTDPRRCGLSELGRPAGFLDRQLDGWRQRWATARELGNVPLMDEVAERLSKTKPPSASNTAILHNDFKLDNCQFDPTDPDHVKSVFDWDMATLGDPLVDLGILLNYWPDPGDADLVDGPSLSPGLDTMGLPSRHEIWERYQANVSFACDTITWYEAFAAWRNGVALQQLWARWARNETADARNAAKGAKVASRARRAAALLDSRPI
jgi:aminoglycoside phosphotransferase (APT) family kinase protein